MLFYSYVTYMGSLECSILQWGDNLLLGPRGLGATGGGVCRLLSPHCRFIVTKFILTGGETLWTE
jgi:hypothetical protein